METNTEIQVSLNGSKARPSAHTLQQRIDRHLADPNLMDMTTAVAQLKAMTEHALEMCQDKTTIDPYVMQQVESLINTTAKTAERIERMQNARSLTVAEVRLFVARATEVASKYFPDPETRENFLRDMKDTSSHVKALKRGDC